MDSTAAEKLRSYHGDTFMVCLELRRLHYHIWANGVYP